MFCLGFPWPPDMKNWLIGKDPDAGKDWRQEEKGMIEDEMVGWHHRLDGVSSGSWWRTGRPGVLQSMGSQRVGHNWTELNWTEGFPGGPVVKSPPCNVGDTGLIHGPGRSHMLWGNYWSPCATTTEPMCCNYWSPHTTEPKPALPNKRGHVNKKPLP